MKYQEVKLPEKCPDCNSTEIYTTALYEKTIRPELYLSEKEVVVIGVDIRCQECGNVWHVGDYEDEPEYVPEFER